MSASMAILLKNGRTIDPANRLDRIADLQIENGCIARIAPSIEHGGIESVDCTGYWIVPGLIDPHVHLRDPGFPQKETIPSGLRAAAAGGFTTVAAMANTSPVNDSPEITRYMLARARSINAARLAPVSAVTRNLAGRELVNVDAMLSAGARMFSDDGVPVDDEHILQTALERIGRTGLAISLHEEDRALTSNGAMSDGAVARKLGVRGIPAAAESQRVRRDLAIARVARASVHLAHISTAESIELVRAARLDGIAVTCEAAPHHFTLTDDAVREFGPDARMTPPLRSRADRDAIRSALADGTIDMIASDHAPHDPESKHHARLASFFPSHQSAEPLPADAAEALAHAANGIVGIETSLGLATGLVHEGLITPSRLIELMSLNPGRLLRLDHGGTLTPGAPADVTVIDPNLEWTVEPSRFLSLSRNTPFSGMRLRGRAVMTIVDGGIVYDNRATRSGRGSR
jgi:dihydroorotase